MKNRNKNRGDCSAIGTSSCVLCIYETVTWEMGKWGKHPNTVIFFFCYYHFYIFMLCNLALREYANHCDVVKIKNKLLFLTFILVSVDCCNMHTNTHHRSGCTTPLPGRSRMKIQKKDYNNKSYLLYCLHAVSFAVCNVCFSSISCRYLARVASIVFEQKENKHSEEIHWK